MDDLNEKIKRVFADLEIRCVYNMPSFWANGGNDYKVIPTRYAKGYQKALEDAEREITEVLSEQPEHTETHSCDYERTETHDLVSRDAVIKAILQLDNLIYTVPDYIDAVRSVPSAEPESRREWYMKGYRDAQPRWISVTERLPEEKQDVLLAFKHNMVVGFWEDILNDGGQAWYANSGNGWFTGTEAVDDDGFPLAWMPLPPSYKGDEDERD